MRNAQLPRRSQNVQKLPSTRATPVIACIHQCVPEPGSIQRTMIAMRQRSHVWVSTSGRERLVCLCRSVKWLTMPMPTQAITRRPKSQCKQPSTQSNVNTSQHSSEPLRVTSQGASRHHRCAAGYCRNCSPRDAGFHHCRPLLARSTPVVQTSVLRAPARHFTGC